MPMTVIPSTPGLPLLAFTRRNAAFRFSRSHTSSINRFVLAGLSVPFVAPDDSVPSLPASRASPVSLEEKSSCLWIFCCLSSLRLMAYWPLLLVRAFSHRSRHPCFFQTPPRGGGPCISLGLHLHQVGRRTCTSKLLNMPSTQRSRWRGGRYAYARDAAVSRTR